MYFFFFFCLTPPKKAFSHHGTELLNAQLIHFKAAVISRTCPHVLCVSVFQGDVHTQPISWLFLRHTDVNVPILFQLVVLLNTLLVLWRGKAGEHSASVQVAPKNDNHIKITVMCQKRERNENTVWFVVRRWKSTAEILQLFSFDVTRLPESMPDWHLWPWQPLGVMSFCAFRDY